MCGLATASVTCSQPINFRRSYRPSLLPGATLKALHWSLIDLALVAYAGFGVCLWLWGELETSFVDALLANTTDASVRVLHLCAAL